MSDKAKPFMRRGSAPGAPAPRLQTLVEPSRKSDVRPTAVSRQRTKLPFRLEGMPTQSRCDQCSNDRLRKGALHLMFATGTEPQMRESFELLRLSPITNT